MKKSEAEMRRGTTGPGGLETLRRVLGSAPGLLARMDEEEAARKPAPSRWSKKEELGHLIDSAFNNHARLVRGQVENRPAMPGYDGDAWVALHRYGELDWDKLIDGWVAANRQLLRAAEAAGEAAWTRTLTIAGSEPVTLAFVLDDYVQHLLHHLGHIGIDLDPWI